MCSFFVSTRCSVTALPIQLSLHCLRSTAHEIVDFDTAFRISTPFCCDVTMKLIGILAIRSGPADKGVAPKQVFPKVHMTPIHPHFSTLVTKC